MEPHASQPALVAGSPLESANAAMIMLHGRGSNAEDILGLAQAIDRPFSYVAPQAAGGAWYPFPFMSPRQSNEPGLSSALSVIESLVTAIIAHGIPTHRIALLGFSQGACLASEFAIRHPRRYGGLLALSGGLIGPPETAWDDIDAKFDDMPVFLGCSDVDPHIPKERVFETGNVFTRLGARVTRTIYRGMPHTVIAPEIKEVQRIVDEILAS